MYQKVTHAWVVLDVNQVNRLYVLFDEHPIEADPYIGCTEMDTTKQFCEVFSNGIVKRTKRDINNFSDYYKTRYCTESGERIDAVPITEIYPKTKYPDTANRILITREFAERILADFHLPFRCIKGKDYIHDDGMALIQSNADALVGTMVSSVDYGPVYVLEHKIGDPDGTMNDEWFKVRLSTGDIHYLAYDQLIGVYKGLTMTQFRNYLNNLSATAR